MTIGIVPQEKTLKQGNNMFNNLKIDLGAESRVRPVAGDFDTLEAYAEVVAATEDLERNDMQMSMLRLSIDNVEKGQALAAAVADATGDQGVAVAVGAESLRSALSVIGQDKMSVVMVGAESVAAGTEGVSDVMKAMWDKVKEMAKKVWEYIRNLIAKVMNFIKGIFGKAEDTAEVISKLVKEAKKDGRTQLKVNEFSEDVQKRLAKEYGALLVAGKNIDEPIISETIDGYKTFVQGGSGIKDEVDIKETEINKLIDIIKKLKAGDSKSNNNKSNSSNSSSIYITPTQTAKDVEEMQTTTTDLVKQFKEINGKKLNTNGYDKLVKGTDIETAITDAIGDDVKYYDATIMKVLPHKVTINVKYITDSAVEAMSNLEKGKDNKGDSLIGDEEQFNFSAFNSLLGTITNGINVKEVTYTPTEDEYMDNKDRIVPLELSDAENIAKKLKDASKNLTKFTNDYDKTAKKAEKDQASKIKDLEDTAKEETDDAVKKIRLSVIKLINRFLDIERNVHQAKAASITAVANELARSKFTHTIKESERLWVKK